MKIPTFYLSKKEKVLSLNGKKQVVKTWIPGGKGLLSATVTLPAAEKGSKVGVAIIMHGFMAFKEMYPIKDLAQILSDKGFATVAFDFNGHGRSDGKFRDMTILNEKDDALAVFRYVRALDFADKIVMLGHSQGGLVASLCAGELKDELAGVVMLAAAAVAKDDALKGQIMNGKFDPANPPEIVRVFMHPLGRNYILTAQKLDIFGTVAKYKGPMCLIHGTEDDVVPYSYSERYHEACPQSELILLKGEKHFLNGDKAGICSRAAEFAAGCLG